MLPCVACLGAFYWAKIRWEEKHRKDKKHKKEDKRTEEYYANEAAMAE